MMNFGHQIAMGMLHLSSLNLVHMDLAARNVLLHTDSLCKVADMGITRELDKKGEYIIGQVGFCSSRSCIACSVCNLRKRK